MKINQYLFVFSVVSLGILFSCDMGSDEVSLNDRATFTKVLEPFYHSAVEQLWVSPNGQYMVGRGNEGTSAVWIYSNDGGASWSNVNSNESRFKYFKVQAVGNDGRVLFSDDYKHFLFENGTLAKTTPPNPGFWDLAYLDGEGNLYYLYNCNCSVESNNALFLLKSGSSTYESIDLPEGFSFSMLGTSHSGGISYYNRTTSQLFTHLPATNTWDISTANFASIANKVQVYKDGILYGANQNGVSYTDASGNQTDLPFPQELTNYQNPQQLIVTDDNQIFVLLAVPNAIYTYKNDQWQKVFEATANPSLGTGILYNVGFANGSLYYFGSAPGKRPSSILKHDLTTGAKAQLDIDIDGQMASLQDAILVNEQKFILILNSELFEYDVDSEILSKIEGISAVSLFIDKEGKIFAFGADVNVSTDGGATWQTSTTTFGTSYQFKAQQLNDGSYMAFGNLKYKYYLGGTGFSVDKYNITMSSSTDGVSWSAASSLREGGNIEINGIDKDGIIFGTEYESNSSYQTFSFGVRSEDNGATFDRYEGDIVDHVNLSGEVYSIVNFRDLDNDGEEIIKKWTGSEWKEIPVKFVDENNSTNMDVAHSLPDGRLLIIKYGYAYLSKGKL